MPAGLRRLVPVATVALIALAAPTVALADKGGKCNASACKVYVEQDVPNAGNHQRPQAQQSGGSKASSGHKRDKVSQVLALAGSDRGALRRLLADSGSGKLEGGNVRVPSALGAAFDLGSGPTALLAILLATVVGVGAHNGWRGWRHRRPSA